MEQGWQRWEVSSAGDGEVEGAGDQTALIGRGSRGSQSLATAQETSLASARAVIR